MVLYQNNIWVKLIYVDLTYGVEDKVNKDYYQTPKTYDHFWY